VWGQQLVIWFLFPRRGLFVILHVWKCFSMKNRSCTCLHWAIVLLTRRTNLAMPGWPIFISTLPLLETIKQWVNVENAKSCQKLCSHGVCFSSGRACDWHARGTGIYTWHFHACTLWWLEFYWTLGVSVRVISSETTRFLIVSTENCQRRERFVSWMSHFSL